MLGTISKDDLEKINEIFKMTFRISLIIGGLVMMSYYYTIGFFPYDLSIGDGLLFIGVAITFGFIDILITTLFSCVGFKLRGVMLVAKKIYIKIRKENNSEDDQFTLIPKKTEGVIWIPALLGWFIILKISITVNLLNTITSFLILTFLAWLCAHSVSSYWEIREEEFSNSAPSSVNKKRLKTIYLLVLLFSPIFIGGIMPTMSTGAMRLMQIRQDNVTVHIATPYTNFVVEAGVNGEASPMGKEYLKFEKVDVLYTGPGKNTLLRFSKKDMNTTKLTIPTDKIYIQN